ncbi:MULTISPECIES: hypothetical protein [Cupriavidus]|uniref:hypothetical protein n=1 Tax=Cupriavidus TaxID=106589 RepID=UPI0011294FC3|nr:MULTISPECIES: hypothetical protein [Cupriavidus]
MQLKIFRGVQLVTAGVEIEVIGLAKSECTEDQRRLVVVVSLREEKPKEQIAVQRGEWNIDSSRPSAR